MFFAVLSASAQIIDLNGSGMSTVWEWSYNAYGINPDTDSDGDGFLNWQEAIAGTDPYNSNSFPHFVTFYPTVTNMVMIIPSQPGKLYTLESTTTITNSTWIVETNFEPLSGASVTFAMPYGPEMKYYKFAVSDVDSDDTGLMNDWEKLQLGLSVTNSFSNDQEDFSGFAMSDYEYVTNLLAQQNVMTIAASDPTATEPGPGQKPSNTGLFTITRGGFPLDAITVNLGLGSGLGYATPGLDYSNLPASIKLPVGTSSATITLTPFANPHLATPAIAQLQLLPGPNYTVGTESNAAIVIYPSPTAVGNGLLGQYYTNSSAPTPAPIISIPPIFSSRALTRPLILIGLTALSPI
jgi:hypothetical protein